MFSKLLNDYFEQEKSWLIKHINLKNLRPWSTEKIDLESKIKKYIEESNVAIINDVKIHYGQDEFLLLFWACVSNHWQLLALAEKTRHLKVVRHTRRGSPTLGKQSFRRQTTAKKRQKKQIRSDSFQRSVSFENVMVSFEKVMERFRKSKPLNFNFELEKIWLKKQPGMQPWEEKGKVELEKKLTKLIDATIDDFFEEKQVNDRSIVFLQRLWACVSYFWKKEVEVGACVSFEEVIQIIIIPKQSESRETQTHRTWFLTHISDIDLLFEHDRFWLEHQPGMKFWENGKIRLKKWLVELLDRVIKDFFTDQDQQQIVYRPKAFLPRLWSCVSYFWKKAVSVDVEERTFDRNNRVSFAKMIHTICQVEGDQTSLRADQESPFVKPNITRNPAIAQTTFPDIVYSVFYARVTHSSVDEQDVMKEYYQDVLMQKSYQIRDAYDYDTWGEFEDYLRGWQQPEVKIYPYEGRASLKAWLSIIASNFSLDSKKSKRELTQMLIERQTIIDENTFSTFGMGNKDDEEKEAETRRDVEEKKKKEVRQYIINHINGINEPLDKLILKQYYFIKAKQQDIANEIGVDTATVSRRLTNIVLRIYEEAVEHFSNKYMVQPIPQKPKKNEENKKLKEEYKKYMERIKCIIKEYLNIHGEKIIA